MFLHILFFVLQFFVFAACGALAYLSARAWLDPTAAGRKRGTPTWTSPWAQFARALAFSILTLTSLLSAVYEGATGIHLDAVSLARILAFVVVIVSLAGEQRKRALFIASCVFLFVGEGLFDFFAHAGQALLSTLAAGALAVGLSLLAASMNGTAIRVKVVDRLVIAFAILSLVLAQIVVVIFVGLILSIGLDLSPDQVQEIISRSDKPILITLTMVLVMSSMIGFFLARDISSPMTRLEHALRAIGEGELDYRVQLTGNRDDEMHDLAREVNRMAQRLKSAESVRAEFFSFVSHELRSPLTSIRGFIQTLQAEDDFSPEDRQEIYAIIHDESDRLLRMIGELLDVARIEAGRPITLQKRRFDASRHVEKVAEIMRAHTRKHTLIVRKPTGNAWIEADPDKFDQILINLLSNAIKYTPEAGDILIKLTESVDSISISVEDKGMGMTPSQTQHVFDKFYRVSDESHQRLARIEGSGIGLYLTRALVESHGGKIGVQSTVGEGTTFTVVLPKIGPEDAAMVTMGGIIDEADADVLGELPVRREPPVGLSASIE